MLLGKRPRPPIRRTTSMTGITVDATAVDDTLESSDAQNTPTPTPTTGDPAAATSAAGHDQRFLATMLSPRNQRRNPAHGFLETAYFLRTCGLCRRRLLPGKDIYMYRGDAAFCSLECRAQQMMQDEIRERYSAAAAAAFAAKKDDHRASQPAASSKGSGKGRTVAAG